LLNELSIFEVLSRRSDSEYFPKHQKDWNLWPKCMLSCVATSGPEGFQMSRPLDALIGPAIMATFAIVSCLAVFAPGALGMTELTPEPPAIAEGPLILLKGGACSLLEWPNYEQSCQFDQRRPARVMRTVRIIPVL
jgi:hypothetical protein